MSMIWGVRRAGKTPLLKTKAQRVVENVEETLFAGRVAIVFLSWGAGVQSYRKSRALSTRNCTSIFFSGA